MIKIKELAKINSRLVILEADEDGITVTTEFKCYKVKDGKLIKLDIAPNTETVNELKRAMKDVRLQDPKILMSKTVQNYIIQQK